MLVEIQALVGGTPYSQPRRMTLGIDAGRFAMLLAVLERRVEQVVMDKDVFVNVAGGLKLRETAADLAVAMAIVSATLGRPVPDDIVFFGEIGLAGEVRSVDRAPQRLREARAHGFMRCLAGRGNATAPDAPSAPSLVPVDNVEGAIQFLFQGIRLVPR